MYRINHNPEGEMQIALAVTSESAGRLFEEARICLRVVATAAEQSTREIEGSAAEHLSRLSIIGDAQATKGLGNTGAVADSVEIQSKTNSADSTKDEAVNAIRDSIRRLGDEEYDVRRAATLELKKCGVPAVRELVLALHTSNDAEIRRRAKSILESLCWPSGMTEIQKQNQDLDKLSSTEARLCSENDPIKKNALRSEYEQLQASTLKSSTPKVDSLELKRISLVKLQLELTVQHLVESHRRSKRIADDSGESQNSKANEKPDLKSIQSLIDSMKVNVSLIDRVRSQTARERVVYADRVAKTDPGTALYQLKMSRQDDGKNFDGDNLNYCIASAKALVASEGKEDLKEVVKDWKTDARAAGVDMKYLETLKKLVEGANRLESDKSGNGSALGK